MILMEKNNLLQLYREACPQRQRLLLECQTPVCFIPHTWPISPWISSVRQEGKKVLVELDAQFPLKSLTNLFFPNTSTPDLFQIISILSQKEEPYLFVLSTVKELDAWSLSFFVRLFQASETHQLWIHGDSPLLKKLLAQNFWTQLSWPSEENVNSFQEVLCQKLSWPLKPNVTLTMDDLFFIGEASFSLNLPIRFFKKFQPTHGLYSFWDALKKQYQIQEQDELFLKCASLEGVRFSAQILYLLLQKIQLAPEHLDILEDCFDEQLAPFIEHIGFVAEHLSCYQFRFSWMPQILYSSEFLSQHPSLSPCYWGALRLFQCFSYSSEGIKYFEPKAPLERHYWRQYCLFGSVSNSIYPLEILLDSLKDAFRQYMAFEGSEKFLWQKSEKKISDFLKYAWYPWQDSVSLSSTDLLDWRNKQDVSFSTRPLFEKTLWSQTYRRALLQEKREIELPALFQEHFSWLEHSEENREKGNCCFEQGLVALHQKQEKEALSYFYESSSYYERGCCFPELVYSLQRIFDLEFRQDNFDKAIFSLNQAKPYLVPQTSAWFLIYHRIGYFYQMFGDLELSQESLEKAEEAVLYGPPEEVFELFARIAHLHLNQLDYDSTRYYYQKALPWAKKQKERYRETLVLTNLADVYLRLFEPANARPYYQQALQLWETFSPEKKKEYHSVVKQPLDDMKFLLDSER